MEFQSRNGVVTEVIMRKPADMHHHFRSAGLLKLVAPMVSRTFSMAVAMPNVSPPVTTPEMLEAYRQSILDRVGDPTFRPLMTLYLTDTLTEATVEETAGLAVGIKYYPRGLTTNSESGVADPTSLWSKGAPAYNVLRVLNRCQGVLLLHATEGLDRAGREIDPFDQEASFIRNSLPRIIDAHPGLKISVEHLSTQVGAQYMYRWGNPKLGCSITVHHLSKDRRDMFRGGFNPHCFWWPILQTEYDKLALRELVSRNLPFVWLGTDSAPHPIERKESSCCPGGVLTAHAALELYTEIFDDLGLLSTQTFENFAALNGPQFFGLRPSDQTITLIRKDWVIPAVYESAPFIDAVVPFRAGETLHWQVSQIPSHRTGSNP